jgi:hypothetical protein
MLIDWHERAKTMKYRISKKTMSQMPCEVAEQIQSIAADFGIKKFSYDIKPQGYKVWHAEGSRYFYVYGNRSMSVEMASEANVGAMGVRSEIGAEVQPPAGTTVIEVWYYAGFGMSVVNIGEPALKAA